MTRLPRSTASELLDEEGVDPVELDRSLSQVSAVDRWLGGERAVRRDLEPWVSGRPEGVVLDVGTGNGDVLRRTVAWARRAGGPGWWGVGLDVHPAALDLAPDPDAPRDPAFVRGDAGKLPFADGSFDVVVATLTLHHFPAPDAVRVLAEMGRVSRGVVVVSDLERSVPHYLGARLLAATWWLRSPVTRHDGPLSVLRSFTPGELADLARKAGLRHATVRRHPLFRLILLARVAGPVDEAAPPPGIRPLAAADR